MKILTKHAFDCRAPLMRMAQVLLLTGCFALAPISLAQPLAFVAHEGGGLSIIDRSTYQVVDAFPQPGTAYGFAGREIAMTPDGRRMLRNGSRYSSTALVYNVQTWTQVASLEVQSASGVSVSPDGRRAFIGSANAANQTIPGAWVSVFDLDTYQEITKIHVTTPSPRGTISAGFTILSPDGSKAFVINWNAIEVIDTGSLSIVDRIDSPTGALFTHMSVRNGRLYCSTNGGYISIFDIETFVELGRLDSPGEFFDYTAAVASADNQRLYAVNRQGTYWDWDISDPANPVLNASFELETTDFGGHRMIELTPDGSEVWVVQRNDPGAIWILDAQDSSVIHSILNSTGELPLQPIDIVWGGGLTIEIDIKPNDDSNCINMNGHGVIPVALLGSGQFDVGDVDFSSLALDGMAVRVRGNRGPLCSFDEVNGDAHTDLVCHFEDDPDNWVGGSDTATVTGMLLNGQSIEGSDSICIVP